MGFGKDKKGVIVRNTDIITLGTLAAVTALKQDNALAMTDSLRILKTEGRAHIEGSTLVEGDGPIGLYLVSTDLSNAEIAAAINSDGPVSRQDTVQEDLSMRPVYKLGELEFAPHTAASKQAILEWSRTIRWTFGDGGSGGSFGIVAFNYGSNALTTGGIVRFTATHFGVWVGA